MKAKWIILPAVVLMIGIVPAHANQEWNKKHNQHGKMLENADQNEDGIISKEEFLAGPTKKFEEMDIDGDGNITPEEIDAHKEIMREKMKAMREEKLDKKFEEMDTDGDGLLSKEEMASHHEAMKEKREERRGERDFHHDMIDKGPAGK